MEATSEALALFSAIRELCRSTTKRIENLSKKPHQYQVLKDELSIAVQKANLCRATLEEYCEASTTEVLTFELLDLQRMIQTIMRVEKSVDELEKKLPTGRRWFKKIFRANRNAEEIAEEVQIVQEVSSQLSGIGEKLKGFAQRNDIFRPDTSSVPKLRVPVYLDYSNENTMEGRLKAELLESINRPAPKTPNVYGHVTAVVSVSGMGGVGKTTALLGLAQDPDVQKTFSSGGIYFVVVGKEATETKLVANLKEIVRQSGGGRVAERIDNNGSLESAVTTTSSWFSGRQALFILDDIWEMPSNQLGYYETLVGLLDDSPNSHILISTRSATIAYETSSKIEFEPRKVTGSDSRGMFLASAGLNETLIRKSNCEEPLQQVLKLCGGVPLMLSIAGAQTKWHGGTPTASLEHLIHSLNVKRVILPEAQRGGQYPSCFNEAVKTSLETIAHVLSKSARFEKAWDEFSRSGLTKPENTVSDFVIDCFRRLCVLPRSARVSEDVVFGIWGSIDNAIAWSVIDALVNFHLCLEFKDDQGKSKFGLHDVMLDYCEKESQFGQYAKYEHYHREFLIHAWKLCHRGPSVISDTASAETSWDCNIAQDAFWVVEACEYCRPWWKILSTPEELSEIQNYLRQNIFRHLTSCSRLAEAVGLISHMGWTKLRISRGGIIALNDDFSFVCDAIQSRPHHQQDLKACENALLGITTIWNMLKRAWPVILNNSEALPTHAYGYLLDKENDLPLVERYLKSALDIASGAWLKPKSAFWNILDCSGNSQVFRSAEAIWGFAVVKDSKMILAATKSTLFWIDVETMTAVRERVIRDEEVSHSQIRSFGICERLGIIVLGFNTGELELREEKSGKRLRVMPSAHDDIVYSVDISEDGRAIVSGSMDKTVRLWDTQSGTQIGEPLCGHEDTVMSVAFSGDGQRVVSGSMDKTVRLWDTQSGAQIGDPLYGHGNSIWSVAFSEDGRRVVSGSEDTTVRLWDTTSRTQIGNALRGHAGPVISVAFSGDGHRVVSGSSDNTVRLWDAEARTQIGDPLRGHDSSVWNVAFSGDGRKIVSGSKDNTVRLWDTQSRTQISDSRHGHVNTVWSVAFSGDGQRVVSCSVDNTVRLWETQSGTQIGDSLRGHEGPVISVAFSADGQTVVSCSEDKTIRLWDTQSGTQIGDSLRGHEGAVTSVAFNGDGRTIASGSVDHTVRLWDTQSGTQIGEPLRGHEDTVTSVAISGDGQSVVSGSRDNTIRQWDIQSGAQIGDPLRGHVGTVISVALNKDGHMVVSGSRDNTVRLWDTQSGTQIGDPLHGIENTVWSVACSGDGRLVMARYLCGTVILWIQDESGPHWKRYCVCSIPVSTGWATAFMERQGSSEGKATLVCPLLGGMMFFDLIEPR